ncbi:MAG: hypothetical protein JW982_02885 [Spirochaetes bacterium]|nr:hypothetical protein [Spirochaetota bacterium]
MLKKITAIIMFLLFFSVLSFAQENPDVGETADDSSESRNWFSLTIYPLITLGVPMSGMSRSINGRPFMGFAFSGEAEFFFMPHLSLAMDLRFFNVEDSDVDARFDSYRIWGPGIRWYLNRNAGNGFFAGLYYEYLTLKRADYDDMSGDTEFVWVDKSGFVETFWTGYRMDYKGFYLEFSTGVLHYSIKGNEFHENGTKEETSKEGFYFAGIGFGAGLLF